MLPRNHQDKQVKQKNIKVDCFYLRITLNLLTSLSETLTMYVMGIETSCDDTSVAISFRNRLIAMAKYTQEIHTRYGGVVPEISAREHLARIVPVAMEALKIANIPLEKIDIIGVTRGPGLLGSLVVGTSFAKALSIALKKPVWGVNHLIAHVNSIFIEDEEWSPPSFSFPFLAGVFSGGHSFIAVARSHTEVELVATTLDDAAGEALDKGGRMMGLPFPAGPHIDTFAQKGNQNAFPLPQVRCESPHFSFSGLKTALLYLINKEKKKNPRFIEENLPDLCASYQKAIFSHIIERIKEVVAITDIRTIAIVGGVAANSYFRTRIDELKKEGIKTYCVPVRYATDNGAMVAVTAYFHYIEGIPPGNSFEASPRIPFPLYK